MIKFEAIFNFKGRIASKSIILYKFQSNFSLPTVRQVANNPLFFLSNSR